MTTRTPWSLYDQDDVTDPDALLAAIAQMQRGRSPASISPTAQPPGFATGRQSRQQDVEKVLRVVNETSYADPEKISELLQSAAREPDIVEQKESVDALRSAILAQLGRARGVDYVSPLSYLAHYFTGGKAPFIAPQPTPQKQLFDYALKLQDKQRDLLKAITDRARLAKGGTIQQQDLSQKIMETMEKPLDVRPRAQKSTSTEPKPTEAQKSADRTFGKEYAEYVAAGGFADVQKSIDQLREVRDELKKTDSASGPIVGSLPKWVRARVVPKSIDIQERVEDVVQRNLKKILGGQFTEREGERLISRAYNPALPESENIKRLDRLVNQMQRAAEAMKKAAEYYETHGTIVGFKGRLPSWSFFDDDTSNQSVGSGGSSAPKVTKEKAIEELRRRGVIK